MVIDRWSFDSFMVLIFGFSLALFIAGILSFLVAESDFGVVSLGPTLPLLASVLPAFGLPIVMFGFFVSWANIFLS